MDKPKPNQWKAAYYHEKAAMIPKFYQYVQETHANHFTMRWSRWLRSHLTMEDASPTQSVQDHVFKDTIAEKGIFF